MKEPTSGHRPPAAKASPVARSRQSEAGPERLWFKIGEASHLVGASPKELRYWEDRIPEIRPRRSEGKLRYYHRDDLPRLVQIKAWLLEGLTVSDCRQLMLHGHLTPRLDLGLEPEELPEQPGTKGKKIAPIRSTGNLTPIKQGLKDLIARLSRPVSLP